MYTEFGPYTYRELFTCCPRQPTPWIIWADFANDVEIVLRQLSGGSQTNVSSWNWCANIFWFASKISEIMWLCALLINDSALCTIFKGTLLCLKVAALRNRWYVRECISSSICLLTRSKSAELSNVFAIWSIVELFVGNDILLKTFFSSFASVDRESCCFSSELSFFGHRNRSSSAGSNISFLGHCAFQE